MNKYSPDSEAAFYFFNENYKKYGYSERSLAWNKGKQNIRFEQLTKYLDLRQNMSILDIGCGFGDLNKYLLYRGSLQFTYTGIDLVEGFIDTANKLYGKIESADINFICGDFLDIKFDSKYDYVIGSGIFNLKLKEKDNYKNVFEVMQKALDTCREDGAIAFDFQSDKVDYKNNVGFYYSPEKILEMAYGFSRNVILDNSYMPFEFSLVVFKNDSFNKETTTFNRYMEINKSKYEEGVFNAS